jgi:hypothetical protein
MGKNVREIGKISDSRNSVSDPDPDLHGGLWIRIRPGPKLFAT